MGILGNLFKKPEAAITIDKRIKLSPGESSERTTSSEKRPKPTLDEQWQNISRQSQTHLKQGDLGLYACDLYSLSEIYRKEAHYNDQMNLLILSAYIHLSGISTIEEYNYWKNGDFSVVKPMPLLPPCCNKKHKVLHKKVGDRFRTVQKIIPRNCFSNNNSHSYIGDEKIFGDHLYILMRRQ